MTVRDALREGSDLLARSGSESPYLDALVMLAEASGISKERLYGALSDTLAEGPRDRYARLVARRRAGTPIAYLTHRKEFYGREFYVDERVLIPRDDTETLVQVALDLITREPSLHRVHDLGAGSGCIALTLKAERPELEISASDSSPAACEVFRINAERLHLTVPVCEAAYFESFSAPVDLIVSNPPYLTEAEAGRMQETGWPEPQEALRSGVDGLDHIGHIIVESVHFLSKGGRLVLEASPPQMAEIVRMMVGAGFTEPAVTCDLAGRERVVSGVNDG